MNKKSSKKTMPRGHTQKFGPEDFSPRRSRALNDPPQTEKTVRVSKLVPMPLVSGETTDLTPAKLFNWIQGSTVYYNKVRVEKVQAWADAVPGATVNLVAPGDNSWDQPPLNMDDSGISGSRRPALAFTPGLLQRARWFTPTDTTVLASARVGPGISGLIIASATFST